MRRQILCPVSFLLLLLLPWTEAQTEQRAFFKVTPVTDGIKLYCERSNTDPPIKYQIIDRNDKNITTLSYSDSNTGEYTCDAGDDTETKIFVKFRTCDNCIELDVGSIAGIVVGNVVATFVIGVAVYLVASQSQIGPITSNKKGSDRQHLVSNEMSNRASNDHYQPLKHKVGQRDEYDVLNHRR